MKIRANLLIGGVLFATVIVAGLLAPLLAHTDPVMDANLMYRGGAAGLENSGSAPTRRAATSTAAFSTARAYR